jgi:hypothetical protein
MDAAGVPVAPQALGITLASIRHMRLPGARGPQTRDARTLHTECRIVQGHFPRSRNRSGGWLGETHAHKVGSYAVGFLAPDSTTGFAPATDEALRELVVSQFAER